MSLFTQFQEVYSAITTIYTIGKSCTSFLLNRYRKNKIEDTVNKVLDDNVEDVLKDNLYRILSEKRAEINDGKYDSVLDIECEKKIVEEIIDKNNYLKIYEKDIAEYVHDFVRTVLEYYKSDTNKKLIQTIISLNHNAERNADRRQDEIKAEIKKIVYAAINKATNESQTTNPIQLSELPFEVDNMTYKAEVANGNIVYSFGFDVSKKNFKVKLEDIFVVSESKTGLWTFQKISYFLGRRCTTQQCISFSSKTDGIRIIEESGIVAFFKVYNCQSYYIRVFGDMDNLYYERLTEDKYNERRREYREKYDIVEKNNSEYDDWIKCYAMVMYTDFGC